MIWKLRMLLKVIFMKICWRFPNLFSDETYSKILYFIVFGKIMDIHHPKTFNEHIIARKLEEKKYDYDRYTDKYTVREYVKDCVGEDILNPVYGVFNSFDEIDFDALPSAFALKATHASGFNIIVKDKSKLDRKEAKEKFDKWLKLNFYYKDREKNYKNIVPRILCDQYITFDACLAEYKIYCFSGKAKLICQNIEYDGERYTNVYDRDFQRIPVKFGYEHYEYPITDKKDELIAIAEKLAEKFEFVRVDLYENNGKILFSELTFHSGGGLVPFTPTEYDVKFGEFFEKEAEL